MMGTDDKALGCSEEEGALTSGCRAHGKLQRLISGICSLLNAFVTIGILIPRTIQQISPTFKSPKSLLKLVWGRGTLLPIIFKGKGHGFCGSCP